MAKAKTTTQDRFGSPLFSRRIDPTTGLQELPADFTEAEVARARQVESAMLLWETEQNPVLLILADIMPESSFAEWKKRDPDAYIAWAQANPELLAGVEAKVKLANAG